MKKLLLALSIVFSFALATSAQENTSIFKVPDSTTPFGRIKAADTIVFDASTDSLFALTASADATDDLSTASKSPVSTGIPTGNFTIENGDLIFRATAGEDTTNDYRIHPNGVYVDIDRWSGSTWENQSRIGGSLFVQNYIEIIKEATNGAVYLRDDTGIRSLIASANFSRGTLVGDIEDQTFVVGEDNVYKSTIQTPAAWIDVQTDESLQFTGTTFYVDYTTVYDTFKTTKFDVSHDSIPIDNIVQIQVFLQSDLVNPIWQNVTDEELADGIGDTIDQSTGEVTLNIPFTGVKDQAIRFVINSVDSITLKGSTNDGTDIYFKSFDTELWADDIAAYQPWEAKTYAVGDKIWHERDIYTCNTAGAQAASFEANKSKWDVFGTSLDLARRVQTTGILEGGIISIATTTTVNWTSGRGLVSDYSDPENPVINDVTWDAISGTTPAGLGTDGTTLFGYNASGVLQEKLSTAVTIEDAHDIIWFGSATHFSSVIVSVMTAPGNIGYDGIGSFSDFINLVIGPANVDGNVYGPNGSNLNIDVTGGNAFMLGSNFRTNPKLSDIITLGSASTINFFDVYRSAGAGLSVIYNGTTDEIDGSKYDDGSGTLADVSTDYWTIQRIFRSRTGSTFVGYGQQQFSSKELALEAKGDEPFIEKDPLPFLLYRSSLVVQEGATDLDVSADEAIFFSEASFRAGGVQSSSAAIPGITSPGGSDKSVQYNNSNTFGGDTNFTYDSSTVNLGLKSEVGGSSSIEFTNSSDVLKGKIHYDQTTDVFKIDPPASTGIVQIGEGVYIHEGAADGRIDIEAITTAGTAELTLSRAGGGTGLMIDFDDATDQSLISGEIGPLTIETTTDEDIIIKLGGATGKIDISADTLPDTNELVSFTIGGTNGGTANLHIGSRTPEGNVTANGGALYLRDDDTSSDLYIKRTEGGNTGWVDFIHSSSGVKGPVSSTDNSLTIWDGTNGELLKSDDLITISSSASSRDIILKSPSGSGIIGYFLEDSGGLPKGVFEYLEGIDTLRLLVNGTDFQLDANQEIDIFTTSATGQINIAGSNLPDTLPLIQYLTGGANGTSCDAFYGIRDPNSNVTGSPGDLYFRSDNADSSIYIHEGTGDTSSDWVNLLSASGGVTGPVSSTNNSIATWNGTDGDTLADEPDFRTATAGNIFKIELETPAVNDTARYELIDSSSDSAAYWQFNDQSKLTLMLSEAGDLEVGSQFDDLIISVNANDAEIQVQGYTLPDTQELLSLTTGGANGADVDIYVGTRNPNENVTGLPGGHYLRTDGVNSAEYIKTDGASSTSGWSKIMVDSDTNAFGGFGHYENLLTYSEDLDNALWLKLGADIPTVTANDAIAPNGELTADTVTFGGSGGGILRQGTTLTAGTYNVSCWARLVSGSGTLTPRIGLNTNSNFQATSTWERFDTDILWDGAGNRVELIVVSANTPTVLEIWGVQVSEGAGVLKYASTEAFALTAADYGLSVAGNLRTDFSETVSESAGALNTFRVYPGTFGSYVVLADGSGNDNITIESYEDGTQSNIQLDAGTSSRIRSSSPLFRIESDVESVDFVTGGNDTKPPITIESEGTNGAKIQIFSSDRNPNGNVTGLPGDVSHVKDGVSSGSYESLEPTSGTNWFKRVLSPSDEIFIYSGAQFDALATAGVITITEDTTLTIKVEGGFSTTTRIEVTGGDLMMTSEDYQSPGITYTGGGTFFTNHNPGSDIRVRGRLRFKGDGTGTFVSILGRDGSGDAIIDMNDTTIQDWADLGTVQQGVFISNNVSYVLYAAPFKIIQTSIAFNNNVLAFGGLFISISSERAGAESDTVEINGIVPLGLSGSLFRIDPFLADDSRVSVSSIDTGDSAVNVFDITGGTTGLFTAVADTGLPIQAITDVSDDGSGNAVFTTAAAPLVGQTVVQSGFTVNTNYNGTFFCSARTATTYELTDGVNQVTFGTTEIGVLNGDGIRVTSNGHGLSNGDTLWLSSDFTTEYDGGYVIYNVQTNTFDVDADFGLTQAGTWDTSGLDQNNPVIASSGNFGKPSSSVKVEISVSGNIATTIIPAAGAKVIMNATPWSTQTAERIKTDAQGDAIYTGITTAAAKLDGNVLLEPTGSTKSLSCQFVRQDADRFVVNFTNGTNIINEAGHSLVNGNNITFNDSVGTMPVLLRKDIIYFVISVTAGTFQVSYTLGGAAVAFGDDGSGVNTYAMADLHGSKPINSIAANSPRTLVPQALEDLDTNDKTFIVISNEDDATNILVTYAYYRVVE